MQQFPIGRYSRLAQEEMDGLHLRLLLARLLAWPFPNFVGSRVRAGVLRALGFHIGDGVMFWGMPTIIGRKNLHRNLVVGDYVLFNIECFLDLAAPVTIGDRVVLGMQTMIVTGTHEIGGPECRSGQLTPKPVSIGTGVWTGARCTILPGVTICDGAVIAAGAVVNKDVPANSMVAGVPARVIRYLSDEEVSENSAGVAISIRARQLG